MFYGFDGVNDEKLEFLEDKEFGDFIECLLKDTLSSKDPATYSKS